MNIRIVIADDHPVILAGCVSRWPWSPASISSPLPAILRHWSEALSKHAVDVVVTDFSMPGGEYGDGVAMLGFLRRRFPKLPLVVLTSISGVQVLASIGKTGVDCIVGKLDPAADLALAIRAAFRRDGFLSASIVQQLEQLQEVALTKREIEVPCMIAQGMAQKETPSSSSAAGRRSVRRSTRPCASWGLSAPARFLITRWTRAGLCSQVRAACPRAAKMERMQRNRTLSDGNAG